MTKKELATAFDMAKRGDRDMTDMAWCDGFALPDFAPVVCTLRQLAGLIVWQCKYMFGDGWDMAALNEIARHGKRKFTVIG